MAVIGVIDIAMRADVSPFLKGMKRATDGLIGWKKSAAQDFGKGLGLMRAGIAQAGTALMQLPAALEALPHALVEAAKLLPAFAGKFVSAFSGLDGAIQRAKWSLAKGWAAAIDPILKAINPVVDFAAKKLAGLRGAVGPLASAFAPIARFLGTVAGAAGKAGGALFFFARGAIKVGVGIARTMVEVAASILKVGVAAAGVVAVGLGTMAYSATQNIDAQSKLAARLGVSTASLASFQHAAKMTGTEVSTLPEIMGRLTAQIGLAAHEITPAGTALKRLGLDAKSLGKGGPVEAVKSIAEQLAKVKDPGDRAALTMQIFGEQGAKLAGTLKLGRAGIEALEADARKLGLALTDVDYAKVAASAESIKRAEAAFEGVGNQLAVGLAPYIEAAANQFVELATAGGGVGPVIAKGLVFAGTAIGAVADAAQSLKVVFLKTQSYITAGASLIVDSVGDIGAAFEALLNLIPGVHVTFTATLDAIGADLEKLSKDQWDAAREAMDAPLPSAKIKTFFDGIKTSADASAAAIAGAGSATRGLGEAMGDTAFKVAELEKTLKDEVATFGFTKGEIDSYKLAQAGASAADLARVDSLNDQLKTLDKDKKHLEELAKDSKKLYEDTLTPIQKFEKEKEKLYEMRAAGLLDETTFNRGIKKAKSDSGLDTDHRAAALDRGSQEARSSVLSFLNQSTTDDGVTEATKKTAVNTDIAAKAAVESSASLRKLARASFGALSESVGI